MGAYVFITEPALLLSSFCQARLVKLVFYAASQRFNILVWCLDDLKSQQYSSFLQVLRRESTKEKILGVVRQRPGHTCDFSFITISIVLWDGIPCEQADSLYTELTTTLNQYATPTGRKCGTNKG